MASGRRSVTAPPSQPKPAPAVAPPRRQEEEPGDPLLGTKVRVWWEPTDDKQKTGFGGAWWPAKVLSTNDKKATLRVRYDNGEEHSVHVDHVSPYDSLPVDFGKEKSQMQHGEFVEVHNGSKTDPGAWLGRVLKYDDDKDTYTVEYPFHDSKPEKIKASRIRRARLLEDGEWRLIRPHQEWEDGEVTSPKELELITEDELEEVLQEDGPSEGDKKKVSKKKRASKEAPAGETSNGIKTKKSKKDADTPGTPSAPEGYSSLYLQKETRPGGSGYCLVPVETDSEQPDGAIRAYLPSQVVQQLLKKSKGKSSAK